MKTKSITKVTLLSIFVMSVITAVTLNSCQKEVIKPKTITSKSTKTTLNPFSTSGGMLDEASRFVFNPSNQKGLTPNLSEISNAPCAGITYDTISKPYTITYNYGSGCYGDDSVERFGTVIVSYNSQDIRVANNVYTITFQNYGLANVASNVNGSITYSNMGTDNNGYLVVAQQGFYYGQVPSGQTDTFNINYSYEWVGGESSNPLQYLQFNITGSCNGSSSTGQTASTTITQTLTKNMKTPGCNDVVRGETYTVFPDTTQNVTNNYNTPGGCSGEMAVTQYGMTQITSQH